MERTAPGQAEGASSVLVGRDRECARIDGLLEGALAGESGVLIVRGEPGIGKTALLEYAAGRAAGMEVLTTAGLESEADLAFAGLYGLLRPILDRLNELPELQAEALAAALGLAQSNSSDRFLVSAAVLGLLAEAAEKRPVLCVVDDAHWLDTPSTDALVFAARRLRAERVAIVFAVREGEARTLEGLGLPELVLEGLGEEDASALLLERSREIVSSVRHRLQLEAAGNPLALLELPAGLSEKQRAGVAALPDSIPLRARVQAAFAAKVDGLPASTQTMLLIAAADDTGDVATLLSAAAELGVPAEALDPAEASGVLPHTDGPQRVRLLYLSGLIEGQSGWLPDALGPLFEAIEGSEDVSLTLEMVREAYECATYAEANDQLAELCRRAGELQPVTETDRFIAAAVMAWGSELSHDYARGTLLAAEAIERAERLDDPRCLIWAAITADRQGTWGDGLPHANRAVAVARERGLISVLPRALAAQSYELIGRSRFEFAYSAAEEGRRLALDIGQPWTASWNVVDLASIEALRGHEEVVRGHVDVLQELVAASGATLLRILSARALGLLDLTLGRPAEALEHLRSFVVAGAGALTSPVAVLGVPDVIEAAVRAHRLDEVVDHLVRFQEWVERFPTPARRALLARCQALADESDAEPHFVRSIELAEALSPFERARSELLYGEWLRRERRRVDARHHLRAALELFQQMRVSPWEERARSELRASGETARRRDPSTRDQLTPQELQIAQLVSEGMTNPEIGAQLFLSPRTIDYHLRKVFAKLQIASRIELMRMGIGERVSGLTGH